MNKWSMEGGFVERWPEGGGRTTCSKKRAQISTHPFGRRRKPKAKGEQS